eukprot:gene7637-biopygen21064
MELSSQPCSRHGCCGCDTAGDVVQRSSGPGVTSSKGKRNASTHPPHRKIPALRAALLVPKFAFREELKRFLSLTQAGKKDRFPQTPNRDVTMGCHDGVNTLCNVFGVECEVAQATRRFGRQLHQFCFVIQSLPL